MKKRILRDYICFIDDFIKVFEEGFVTIKSSKLKPGVIFSSTQRNSLIEVLKSMKYFFYLFQRSLLINNL